MRDIHRSDAARDALTSIGASGLWGGGGGSSGARSWTILGGGGGTPKSSGGREGSCSSFAGGGRGLEGRSGRAMGRGRERNVDARGHVVCKRREKRRAASTDSGESAVPDAAASPSSHRRLLQGDGGARSYGPEQSRARRGPIAAARRDAPFKFPRHPPRHVRRKELVRPHVHLPPVHRAAPPP